MNKRSREMESELRSLIGKYGMRAVHEGLMKEMRDTFQYLQVVFEAKNEIIHPFFHHNISTVEIVNDTIPEVVHTEEHIAETDSLYDDDIVPEMPKDPTVKEITINDPKTVKTVKAPVPLNQTPLFPPVEVKQQKAKHREEVEKKRTELVAKGIKPESLLTEDNLKKWLGAGQSYQKIAKETGVHESQVATVAKSFGLQSNISKYVAMKKKA